MTSPSPDFREEIARLVDPAAFAADPDTQPTADMRQAVVQRRNYARTKAERIEQLLLRRTAEMRDALEEARDVLALCEHPRHEDPLYQTEVEALGNRIGYGAMMSAAQAAWRKRLSASGAPGGEHVAGPAFATVQRALAMIRAALSTNPDKESGRG